MNYQLNLPRPTQISNTLFVSSAKYFVELCYDFVMDKGCILICESIRRSTPLRIHLSTNWKPYAKWEVINSEAPTSTQQFLELTREKP
jgi:hypothetical protein